MPGCEDTELDRHVVISRDSQSRELDRMSRLAHMDETGMPNMGWA